MDATRLAFRGRSFDAAFSVGLCHHLSREQTERGMAEWMRVLRPGGRLVVIDAILPLRRWNAPGWALRKMDRGAHVLSWREWRARFAALAPAGAELRAFGVFPYDYAVMACEIPRGKSN